MRKLGKSLGQLMMGLAAGGSLAAPPDRAAPGVPASMVVPVPAMPARLNLAEAVRPEFRDAVLKVVNKPTVSTRAVGEEVVCTVAVYEWLYDHSDRVALAWQRLKVPTLTIRDAGAGKFAWIDEGGSEVVWQTVGSFPDGRVWYATGKVKASALTPAIPVQGVVIVSHPKKAERDGVALFAPTVQAYMHSDSRAANLVLRVLGPSVPTVAEDAASQLLDFFAGIANYVQKNPTKANDLLGPAVVK